MRKALLVVLVGCAVEIPDDPSRDVHNLTTCSSDWTPIGTSQRACELACVQMPAYADAGCRARNPIASSIIVSCERTFEYEGLSGCCVNWTTGEPGEHDVRFFVCD